MHITNFYNEFNVVLAETLCQVYFFIDAKVYKLDHKNIIHIFKNLILLRLISERDS